MVLDKIANLGEGRKRKNLESISQLVLTYEPEYEDLSDAELLAKTAEFRQRVENGESLDDLLPEAFAAVREASKRSTGKRHFDVQVMGAAALHQGNIAEMKTGEGKTLVATHAGVPQLAHRRGGAPGDRERLPGQTRLGVDGTDLPVRSACTSA